MSVEDVSDNFVQILNSPRGDWVGIMKEKAESDANYFSQMLNETVDGLLHIEQEYRRFGGEPRKWESQLKQLETIGRKLTNILQDLLEAGAIIDGPLALKIYNYGVNYGLRPNNTLIVILFDMFEANYIPCSVSALDSLKHQMERDVSKPRLGQLAPLLKEMISKIDAVYETWQTTWQDICTELQSRDQCFVTLLWNHYHPNQQPTGKSKSELCKEIGVEIIKQLQSQRSAVVPKPQPLVELERPPTRPPPLPPVDAPEVQAEIEDPEVLSPEVGVEPPTVVKPPTQPVRSSRRSPARVSESQLALYKRVMGKDLGSTDNPIRDLSRYMIRLINFNVGTTKDVKKQAGRIAATINGRFNMTPPAATTIYKEYINSVEPQIQAAWKSLQREQNSDAAVKLFPDAWYLARNPRLPLATMEPVDVNRQAPVYAQRRVVSDVLLSDVNQALKQFQGQAVFTGADNFGYILSTNKDLSSRIDMVFDALA